MLENLPSIAPSEGYPTIYNYRNRALVKEDPVAQHLRGTNDDNFPPFAFPPGVSTEDASLAYTGDIFPLVRLSIIIVSDAHRLVAHSHGTLWSQLIDQPEPLGYEGQGTRLRPPGFHAGDVRTIGHRSEYS